MQWRATVAVLASALALGPAAADDPWRPTIDVAPDVSPVEAVASPARPQPTFEALQASIGPDDSAAALEALQHALDQVGDGAAYIWHRQSGPLWGLVRPLSAQRNARGQPCRRLHISLSLDEHTRTTEVTACRASDGRWWLAS